ncbi:MAG: HDOD domain-containing protein [Burkholderiales bacterium]|jgi:HD-like signal output (HDOD) protein
MSVHPDLRSLNIDIPTQPEPLAELSLLLAEEAVNLQSVGAVIEQDMALASAVLKAVNASIYGLTRRVSNVHHAITYLGIREIAGLTFEMALRAVFPLVIELEPIWERAAVRGVLMSRIAQALGADPWVAHSAGLFEECGKAVLYRHDPVKYPELLRKAVDDAGLLGLELDAYGITHDVLGAALCETWGLAAMAVHSVRYHVSINATLQLPEQAEYGSVCAMSILANTLMMDPDGLDEVIQRVAPQAGLDTPTTLHRVRKVQTQIEEAVDRWGT